MTELTKPNNKQQEVYCDFNSFAKSSLNLSLNENVTEAETLTRSYAESGSHIHLNQKNSILKQESQFKIKDVWNHSYNLLSKLSSEELVKLYFNMTICKENDNLKPRFNFELEQTQEATSKQCCTCKHSNCLKLYCACMRLKGYCGSNCKCKNCYNTKDFEDVRNKSINLLEKKRERAFKSVIIETENGSKAHAYGCRCHNSNCEKNYCQCFRNKVKCTQNCKCNGCSNCN